MASSSQFCVAELKPTAAEHYVTRRRRASDAGPCEWRDFTAVENIVNILPDEKLAERFIIMETVERSTQLSKSMSLHEVGPSYSKVNTESHSAESKGINHVEGGWPRDVNITDPDQASRYRKKVEKDEVYCRILAELARTMEHCIKQNNSLDIYCRYFHNATAIDDGIPIQQSAWATRLFRHPNNICGAATDISWVPDGNLRFAVAYSNIDLYSWEQSYIAPEALLWNFNNPHEPDQTLHSPAPVVTIEFNPKDPYVAVGGCSNGQIVIWDIRRGANSLLEVSLPELSHEEAVQSVVWLNSKSGTDFFSGSTDGKILWWDVRKILEPVEELILDPTRGQQECSSSAILGATCLDFEPSMSTKCLVGTSTGLVFLCNRKAKSMAEKLSTVYNAHLGSVGSIQRNPIFHKNFLTVGDWTSKIWSEDVRESPIMWSKYHKGCVTKGSWSPTRPSVFVTTQENGTVDVWDLLVRHSEPIMTIQVCDESLISLRFHQEGRLAACGSSDGSVHIIEFAESMITLEKNDKLLLASMFERETKREKILEARAREQRLREKTPERPTEEEERLALEPILQRMCAEAETNYLEIIPT